VTEKRILRPRDPLARLIGDIATGQVEGVGAISFR
jgi:hypothetical protein